MPRERISLSLLLAAVLACGGGEDVAPADPGADTARASEPVGEDAPTVEETPVGIEISLVDSLPWENALASGVDRRVVVRTDGRVDTVPGVAVAREPIVVADSAVTGFDREGGTIERGFWYAVREDSVAGVPLPDDFLGFTAHAIAPGGSRLAYVGQADDDVRLVAAVRAWPSGEAIWTGAPVEGYPSDATNTSVVWASPDSVEIRIRLDALETRRDLWLRAIGDPAGTMAVDTLDVGALGE